MPKVLRGRGLVLRPVRPSDLGLMAELLGRRDVAVPLGVGPLPRADVRRRLAESLKEQRRKSPAHRTYMIVPSGSPEAAGWINLRWEHRGVGTFGFVVHPDLQGRGLATEALRTLALGCLRDGAHRVQATCWVRNRASARVLEKAGFRREGRLRDYLKIGRAVRDEYLYGLPRRSAMRKKPRAEKRNTSGRTVRL